MELLLRHLSVCLPKTLTKRAGGGKGMGKDGEDGRRVSMKCSDRQGKERHGRERETQEQ